MNILILGGTQLTGPSTIKRLIAQGHQVAVFHRGHSRAELPPSVHHIVGDKDKLADFAGQFRSFAPEVVVNMLCFTESDTREFVNVFRGIARRAVVISSMDVYRAYGRLHRTEPGPPDSMPLTEDSPLREKLSAEGEDYNKTGVERLVMESSDLPATVLRFPVVYGPNDGHRMGDHVRRMDDGRPAIVLDAAKAGWRVSLGYAEDVGHATFLAATDVRAAGRIYNVGEAETPTFAERVRRLGEAAGWNGRVVAVPNEQLPETLREEPDFAQDWMVDTTRIREELGFQEQVTPEEALRRTIAWERANPMAEAETADFDYAAEDAILKESDRSSRQAQ